MFPLIFFLNDRVIWKVLGVKSGFKTRVFSLNPWLVTHFCQKNWRVKETLSSQKGGITLTRSDVLKCWVYSLSFWNNRSDLNAMNISRLWVTWTTLGHQLRALDAMKSSRLWLTYKTLGRELRDLDDMKNSRLWLAWTTSIHERRAWDSKNSLELSMT